MAASHLVVHAVPGWGHTKPLLMLIAHMFHIDLGTPGSLTVTLLTGAHMLSHIKHELQLISGLTPTQLNVIDVSTPELPFDLHTGVVTTLEAISKGRSVVCKTTGHVLVLQPATVVVLDAFAKAPVAAVKCAAGGCPVIAWLPASMSLCTLLHSPGAYDESAVGADVANRRDIADSVFGRVVGRVVRAPGLPDMYDYEYHPQVNARDVSMTAFLQSAHSALTAADGMLAATSSVVESASIEAARKWFGETGREIWIIGPLADAPLAEKIRDVLSADETKILDFLDHMERKHGVRSVIYIAFGSLHYPKDTAKLHAFVEELIASGTPFLWSHASPVAKVPEALERGITAYEDGMHASWVPQRAVLRHAATGWFVSHGGWNSTQEALSNHVPMIMWPFLGDQPGTAALLSVTHKAAFELLSVREGVGAQQPLRMRGEVPLDFSVDGVRQETRCLLARLKSADGERIRVCAEALGAQINQSCQWGEGSEAKSELKRFMCNVSLRSA